MLSGPLQFGQQLIDIKESYNPGANITNLRVPKGNAPSPLAQTGSASSLIKSFVSPMA
jgi:hypothetical protein